MAVKRSASHALARIASEPWMMSDAMLRTFANVAQRATGSPFQALAASMDFQDDDTPWLQVRDGVAVISVIGPIFRYSDIILDLCGGASYARLADAFTQSLADPRVTAIVFDIDSPGGQANGCSEFCDMVVAARGVKPIVAYVGGAACSAAYWIASACDTIICNRTAQLGSIGVLVCYLDDSEAMAQAGIREISIVSSQSPDKRLDPTTPDGLSKMQVLVDDLADAFVSSVASNRGVDVETVLADFGQGGTMIGARAVAAGLADEIGTFEAVLKEIAAA